MKKAVHIMKNSKFSINLSLAVLCIVSVVLAVLLIFGPSVFKWYMTNYRGFEQNGEAIITLTRVFGICFYFSSVFAAVIIYCLFRLLLNIRKGEVFIKINAAYLRVVSWCCFVIAAITFTGGIFYMPLLAVAAAGAFTGVLLRVLKNVMYCAAELKQDNDLTI